jgi:hypothetical protein
MKKDTGLTSGGIVASLLPSLSRKWNKQMKTFALIMTLLTMMFAGTAQANQEWALSEHGFWSVTLVEFDDSSMACQMYSIQHEDDGHSFGTHVWTYGPEGGFYFVLGDSTYNLIEEQIEFQLSIDGESWNVNGRTSGTTVMSNAIFDVEFMELFMNGSSLRWINSDGEWTHQFHLDGSRAATIDLMECGSQIALTSTSTY